MNAAGFNIAGSERGFIAVLHTQPNHFLDQKGIEVGAIPVGVGHEVVGAGRHQELIGTVVTALPGFPGFVMEVAESALETATHVRVAGLPGSPLG